VRTLFAGASGFIAWQPLQSLLAHGRNIVVTSLSRVEKPGIFYVHSPELAPEEDRLRGVGFASGYRKDGSGQCHCKIDIKSLKTIDD
jgi:hypothetical protein